MRLIGLLFTILLLASPTYAVQDSDGNDAIDIVKGGTNAITEAGARTNILGVADPTVPSLMYSNGSVLSWTTSIDIDIILGAGINTAGSIGVLNNTLSLRNTANDETLYFTDDSARVSKAEALTNKTISGSSNTISNIPLATATGVLNGAQVADGTLEAAKLEATNSPVNDYIPSYDSASGGYTWIEAAAGSSSYVSTPWTYSDETCTAGQYSFDEDYFYNCVASGNINRTASTNWSNPELTTYSLTLTITDSDGDDTVTVDSTAYTSSQTITGLDSATETLTGGFGSTGTNDTVVCTGTAVSGTAPNYTIDMSDSNESAECTFSTASTCSTSSVDQSQLLSNSDNDAYDFGQSFQVSAAGYISAISVYIGGKDTPEDYTIRFGTSTDLTTTYTEQVQSFTNVTNQASEEHKFVFATPISVSSGTTYYFIVNTNGESIARQESNAYANGSYWYGTTGTWITATEVTARDLKFEVFMCD